MRVGGLIAMDDPINLQRTLIMSAQMRHLLIFLPGITGSVLQKDGRDVWALSGQGLWEYVRTLGQSLNTLLIAQEDWEQDDLGDGIKAVRLTEDLHSIPHLIEHAGYSVLVDHIKENFGQLEEGNIFQPRETANFFTFPYDWRRDNRVAARQLKNFIDRQLPRWREASGAWEAQVILIGHSLGGLIARYYVEALEGWRTCHTLITVGSPHRGALGALNTLVNGVHPLLGGLNALVRSFESMYQILPAYPAIQVDGQYKRLIEMEALPAVDMARARQARKNFLDAMVEHARRNAQDKDYLTHTLPWLGTHQSTWQSARWEANQLVMSYDPPAGLPEALADGDGVVPRVAAVPIDLDGKGLERFAIEQHGWLTNNPMTLSPLLDTVTQLAAGGTSMFWGLTDEPLFGLSLHVEPVYVRAEPVTVRVKLVADDDQARPVTVRVSPKDKSAAALTQTAQANAAQAVEVGLGELKPGLYELTVSAEATDHPNGNPVHGIFEVIDPALTA